MGSSVGKSVESVDFIKNYISDIVEFELGHRCLHNSWNNTGGDSGVKSRCQRRTVADTTASPLTTAILIDGQLLVER